MQSLSLEFSYKLYYFFDTDSESDIEVPYADIMITVRGVSTPELTQVGCLTPGDRSRVRDQTQHGALSVLLVFAPIDHTQAPSTVFL